MCAVLIKHQWPLSAASLATGDMWEEAAVAAGGAQDTEV